MKALRDRRLWVVEGKGGVGRTTVAAALGLAAARQGRRTLVVELHGEAALAHRLGFASARYEARTVAPGLDLMSLSASACLADFGQRKLHIGGLSPMVFGSRPMTAFVEAVPGLPDVVQLGKIEDRLLHPLAKEAPYDLVVLDGPATGHGLTLLSSARHMRELTRAGPFHDLAKLIETLLQDPAQTATIAVTLPEQLPVQETLELLHALDRTHDLPDLVVVNQRVDGPLPGGVTLPQLLGGLNGPHDAPWRALAVEAHAIARRRETALRTLQEGLSTWPEAVRPAVVALPQLDDPAAAGPAALEPLVAALLAERLVGGAP
jgi:anion-transporting  ArsA/GET3 family ATPase